MSLLVDWRLTWSTDMSKPLVDDLDLWQPAQSESEWLKTRIGNIPWWSWLEDSLGDDILVVSDRLRYWCEVFDGLWLRGAWALLLTTPQIMVWHHPKEAGGGNLGVSLESLVNMLMSVSSILWLSPSFSWCWCDLIDWWSCCHSQNWRADRTKGRSETEWSRITDLLCYHVEVEQWPHNNKEKTKWWPSRREYIKTTRRQTYYL